VMIPVLTKLTFCQHWIGKAKTEIVFWG
jgi:hypothetical protein